MSHPAQHGHGGFGSSRGHSGTHADQIAATILGIATLLSQGVLTTADAQQRTADPGAWRPVSYADLELSSAATATFADIWKDQLEANNRAYREMGDFRYAGGNAPATEAHFVIWSPVKSVVLSVLNTATGCEVKERHPDIAATVRLCPMRVVIYEGIRARSMDAGRGCFLELEAIATPAKQDPAIAAAYVAYDVATKTVKTGLIVDHKAVDGCSHNIPLYPP
jgi:hypothetical protein